MKPDVIAGTSIGAFNGVLTLVDTPQREIIWQRLATKHFVKVSWVTALAIAVRLAKLWALLFRASDRARFVMIILFMTLGLLLAIGCGFLPENTPPSSSLLVAVTIGAFALFTALDIVASLVNRLQAPGLFRIATLGRLVQHAIPWDRLENCQVEIFITLAKKVPRGLGWAPEYLKLNSLSKSDAFRFIVGTMALPMIYPRVLIGNAAYADGGLADNTPIFALADLNCDKIYVVHLNPYAMVRHLWLAFSGLDLRDTEQTSDWFRRISMLRHNVGKKDYEFLFDQEWRERWSATTIVHICPKKKLGCWPLSTIFFSQKSCRRLIELGYRDAQKALNSRQNEERTIVQF
ncbi:hypothetical protein XI03_07705 [Bradyrhizobium sp. CCBAU 65884]|nr:hypothetical protein [Bradyrhizobium sp. CCBAU 65884]